MIYVTGHYFPSTDIDSVFSSILFAHFIEEYYKLKSKPCSFSKNYYVKSILKIIGVPYPKTYTKKSIGSKDMFALVDHNNPSQSFKKFGFNNSVFGVVDHHIDCCKISEYKFKIINKLGSTATIIYNLYKKHNIKINKKQAYLFLYALIADTKNLKLDTTKNADKKMLAELYSNFKLKNRNAIFKDLYSDIKKYNKQPIKKLLNDNLKIYDFNNRKIFISDINIDNSFKRFHLVKDFVDLKTSSLHVVMFKNLEEGKLVVNYFGDLSKYFSNKTYNSLKSRKNFVWPLVKKKLEAFKV